jgi:hypothetical protein
LIFAKDQLAHQHILRILNQTCMVGPSDMPLSQRNEVWTP